MINKKRDNLEQLLGAHTSINGGVSTAVDLAKKLGFTKIITPKNYHSIEEVVRILTNDK